MQRWRVSMLASSTALKVSLITNWIIRCMAHEIWYLPPGLMSDYCRRAQDTTVYCDQVPPLLLKHNTATWPKGELQESQMRLTLIAMHILNHLLKKVIMNEFLSLMLNCINACVYSVDMGHLTHFYCLCLLTSLQVWILFYC